MTLDPGVGTSGTIYKAPHASSYDTPDPSTQDTNALAVKSEQKTHTSRLSLGGCFVSVDVFFFSISETVVYIFILFERLYFIFFIYDLKFSFSYLCFDINFLQNFQIIKHNIFLNHQINKKYTIKQYN
jgi:hypothetical protein